MKKSYLFLAAVAMVAMVSACCGNANQKSEANAVKADTTCCKADSAACCAADSVAADSVAADSTVAE
ncbi:MAG: entericidin [Salinivirgaceae bacterium]|nr:entericidin [Salinivirgaceae bacterium]